MPNSVDKPRVNFTSVKNPLPYPDFLEVQLKSFQDFMQLDTPPEKRNNEGLYKVFSENFPIADTRNNFVLEFLDYYIDPPRYTIDECLEHGLTYSVPLKAKLKLYCTDPDHEDFATVVQDVYLGQIPYMTEKGTFVINGAERVVVSQLHRSPGVFFGQSTHANGTKLYSARIIPFRGSWIEFATDINNVMYAYIDRKKKLPVTTLLRAIGLESDKDIIEIFGLAEDIKVTPANLKKAVGRKLAARVLKSWVEDFADEDTGEVVSIERNDVVIDRETVITEEDIPRILESGVQTILLHKESADAIDYSIIFNTLQKDTSNSEKEAIQYIYRQLRNAEPPDDASAREVITNLFFSEKRYDLGEVGRYRINKKLGITVVVITHQMSVVEEICDSVAILDGGVVVEQGEVREIFANPKTAAARRLVAPNGGSAARDLSSFAPDDHVVRVTFNGSSAAKPLVASLAAEKGILVSVLSADTRDLSGQCYGSMLLKLPRDTEQAKQAAAYMRSQNGVTVEEVTGE